MRPDAALRIERGQEFADYCKHLSEVAGVEISDFEGMKAAISKRYDVAHELGCRASDHALDYVMYVPATADEIETIFAKGLAAEPLTEDEVLKYKTPSCSLSPASTSVWAGPCSCTWLQA